MQCCTLQFGDCSSNIQYKQNMFILCNNVVCFTEYSLFAYFKILENNYIYEAA